MSGLERGTRLGSFEIESLLGVGGMASVYVAYQASLDRRVALKVLAPALVADEDYVRRFQREGVHLARLHHEAIVSVYEAGRVGDDVFLAMQLVEGTTLKGLLADRRPLSPAESLGILTRIAGALDYAHGEGFVHRDVKPANILIGGDGRAYLSDFGITKSDQDPGATAAGHWLGSPAYLAPEQAAGGPVDGRADVYSLGCVAFECLTGSPPYQNTETPALLLAHAGAPVPSARERNPKLPARVDAVLRRALAKDPGQRPDSTRAFVSDLAGALGVAGAASDATTLELPAADSRRWLRTLVGSHRIAVAALAGVVVLGLGAAGAVIATSGGGPHKAAPPATHPTVPVSNRSVSGSDTTTTSTPPPSTTVPRTTTLPPSTTAAPAPVVSGGTTTTTTTAPVPAAPYATISGPTGVCSGNAQSGPSYTYTATLSSSVVSGYWLDAQGNTLGSDPTMQTYSYFYGQGETVVRLVVINSADQSYTATLNVNVEPC